jgi:hypothetical protein
MQSDQPKANALRSGLFQRLDCRPDIGIEPDQNERRQLTPPSLRRQ